MTVYSKSTCPNCRMLKMKLDKAGIEYIVNENEEEMKDLGIKSLPYLQLDDGTLLNLGEAVKYIKEASQK